MTEREFAIDVVRRLRDAGYEALWAGGCVRDELLGLAPEDYDVATAARPEQVHALFRRTVAVGASFGVVEVLGPRRPDGSYLKVQVATFRSDGAYSDGRRPDAVVFSTAEEDAQRRDFTINGMFFDPLDGRVIDYVGGQADLQAGRPAGHRRPARAVPRGQAAPAAGRAHGRPVRLHDRAGHRRRRSARWPREITVVSAERIADELRKMLVDRNRACGMRLLDELGLLRHVLPEVEAR